MMKIRRSETVFSLIMRRVGLYYMAVMLCCMAGTSDVSGAEPQPLFNVGYQILDLKYKKDGQEQTLTVAVWYPTAVKPQPYHYGGSTKGNIAVGAAPSGAGTPYPFLVFSHGYGGSGLSSVFFTEALAAHGWIVACPDHHDDHPAVRIRTGQEKDFDRLGFMQHAKQIAASGPDDRGNYLYRLEEMNLVLNGILTSTLFGKLIDKDRVAIGGHSLGGFTALGLSGTIKERRNPLIKAVLLFSTGAGGYLFRENELSNVRIPSMLFMGEQEENQLRGSRTMPDLSAKIFRNMSPPKYFLVVKGASHFSFNNRFADNPMARILSGTEMQFEVIRQYSIAFLEKYVAGKKDTGHILERGDPMLARYVAEPVVDTAKEHSALGKKMHAPSSTPQRIRTRHAVRASHGGV